MKRHNSFEQEIKEVILKRTNVQLVYRRLSLIATKNIKSNNNNIKLFEDVASPYRTDFGNQKRTEFVLHAPECDIDWRIECKARKKIGLVGEIQQELNFVADISENLYCLVLTDNLMTDYIINQIKQIIIEKKLNNKVWIGTKKSFNKLLKSTMR